MRRSNRIKAGSKPSKHLPVLAAGLPPKVPVHISSFPSEILQPICGYVLDHRSLFFQSPRKDQKHFPQTRPEKWELNLLLTCSKFRDEGKFSLKKALASTTVTFSNFTPSSPTIRGGARVTDFTSDEQRSKNFLRYHSFSVREVQILGWPQDNISLEAFGNLKTLTIGTFPIWLKDDPSEEAKRLLEDQGFENPLLKQLVISEWERDARWTGGIQAWRVKVSPDMRKIIDCEMDGDDQTEGRLMWRGKRTFNLRCRVVVDFFNIYEDETHRYVTCTGIIDVDKGEVIAMKRGGHLCGRPEHTLD